MSYDNGRDVPAGEAHPLARVKDALKFSDREPPADGSYRATLYRSAKDRRHDRDGLRGRVIEYTIEDPHRPGSGEPHRPLTTVPDPRRHPARRLIELDHGRWEIERAVDELEAHRRQRAVLRRQTPAGVVQEVYGPLLAHYVGRALMSGAAALDPTVQDTPDINLPEPLPPVRQDPA